MAEYKFTAALNAAEVPPTTRTNPRSILMGQMDNQLKNPASTAANNLDNNPTNLPQVIYAENVLPVEYGIKSVGYEDVGGTIGAGTADGVWTIRADGSTWMLSPANGYNYVKQAPGSPWVSFPAPGAPLANPLFSIAYVNGGTIICYAFTYIAYYDSGLGFVDASGMLLGVAIGDIRAVCGSGNYLILICADDSVKWSSLTNPLDFIPSVDTGAGSQIPVDIRGPAFYATPTAGGFLIHCTENTVAAVYTQNAAQPWVFREVKGSGGLKSRAGNDRAEFRIAKEVGANNIYMMSTNGLQQMSLREADNIHPNITDFVTGQIYETFNSGTNQLTLVNNAELRVRVSYLNNRYLVVSYGLSSSATLNYALIYDSNLKRWGKLARDHVDVFTYNYEDTANPQTNIFMVDTTGQCTYVVMDQRTHEDNGVVILGRYQLNRTNQICSQELELEVLDEDDDVTAFVATNYNGTTLGQILAMTLYSDDDNYRCFQKQIEGENISFIIKGTFTLSTALITATKGARF